MQTLNQFQRLFDEYLVNNSFGEQPSELYKPVSYIMALGGKRLRPLILMLGYSVFDSKVENSLPAAMAIEVFHNFTLMHDDIMDNASLRRGKPSVHEKFGLNSGILSGDVMLAQSYRFLLLTSDQSKIPKLMEHFTKMAIEVCEGQQMDMNFENQVEVSIQDYLKMIELKTSVLVGCALRLGALLGGAKEKDAEHLYEFGRNLGIAFQIQDDILDTFGDPEKFGKKPGGDIIQNKKTILVLKALELADTQRKQELSSIYSDFKGTDEEKITRVKQLFDELNVRRVTEELMASYEKTANKALNNVLAPEDKKQLLREFASGLMKREY